MRPFAAVTVTLLAASLAFGQAKPPLKPKSKAEATAVNAMITAPDPDSRIKAADELITKFADTPYKSIALYMEAESYLQKGDADKSIVFAEQAIDADAANYQALVLLTKTYAATTHINDLDKADKLAKIDKYAKASLPAIEAASKPNDKISDAEWTSAKSDYTGQVYLGMGIAAVFSNKIDDAKADFDKVATMDSDPTDLIRAARALMDAKKWADSIVYLDKAIAFPGAPDQIKKIAENDKARATAMLPKK
jgi:tetratricopeptide (TPR) repeat protein